jgi:methionyl-tRNA synthetase
MDVTYLINQRRMRNIADSMESIKNELRRATYPLKQSFTDLGKKRKEIISRVNELTLEVERMIESIGGKKDIESVRALTKRAREIMEEKELLEKQLKSFAQ